MTSNKSITGVSAKKKMLSFGILKTYLQISPIIITIQKAISAVIIHAIIKNLQTYSTYVC